MPSAVQPQQVHTATKCGGTSSALAPLASRRSMTFRSPRVLRSSGCAGSSSDQHFDNETRNRKAPGGKTSSASPHRDQHIKTLRCNRQSAFNAANNSANKKKMQKQKMHINSLQQQLREQKRETANRSKQAQKERKQREQSERMLESLGALHLTPGTANALKTLFSSKRGAEMQESLQYLESKKPTVRRKLADSIRAKETAATFAAGIAHARSTVQQETLGTVQL